MEFGPKVREIRQKKGFSQKETYNGIISKSYSIEFEKGNHKISTDLLIEILDRLSMDIDEFFYINRGYLLNPYSDYIYRLSNYSNFHDAAALKKMLTGYEAFDDIVNQVRCAEIRCRIRMIENIKETGKFDPAVILKEDRQTIQEYLINIETWTLQEVQLFGNTIEFLEFSTHFELFRNLSKSLTLYMEYDKGREIFCAMLINLITQSIKHDYLDYAEVLNQQLRLLSTNYKEFFHKTISFYFEKVISFKRGSRSDYQEAEQILLTISKLGQPAIAKELNALLNSNAIK
ncbi:Rgg/GadR/MutR family transcriptional regulator [Enterococcus hulanensis]|uniref:helix-turn-helix domain-containing protein n=1 Tax=Enterococcus hulanensis TaxID=2559929 RepID=UPI00288D9ADC|nr:Rgg/GadR/MutR family transcriptional regulator [Enterococcus hulanensis]MDT2661345.1 Rgg/GadR/MutR family transcriptional regulator [Enterococcus hulanensis]